MILGEGCVNRVKYIEILSKVRENVNKFTLVFGELKVGTFEKNY